MDITTAYNIVDTETTGLNPQHDRIIEIAVLRVENNKIVDELNYLVNPHIRISDSISRITGITQEQINHAPEFEEIKGRLKEMLEGKLFVAHNARFDYAFVKNEFIRQQDSITLKTLCTVRLSRILFPQFKSHSLQNLINELNIKVDDRHRALADSRAVFQVIQKAKDISGKKNLNKAVSLIKKKPSIPRYLKQEDIENLPEEPGVYIFSADDVVLYVGKSVNIKNRVKSHFINDHTSKKDLKISTQIKKIETITTAGELGALILESRLVKHLSPLFNKQLRRKQKPVTILKDNSGEYFRAKIVRDDVSVYNHKKILSTHRSVKQAKEQLHKIATENNLCPRLLELDKGTGFCFNYQLEKCNGACGHAESAIKYNVRFIEAFSTRQVKTWPFEGTVALIEQNGIKSEAHIVNNWSYLGTINEEDKEMSYGDNHQFDYDMYKILKRFVYNKSNKLKIVELKPDKTPAHIFETTA